MKTLVANLLGRSAEPARLAPNQLDMAAEGLPFRMSEPIGYGLAATSPTTSRLLARDEPLALLLLAEHRLMSGGTCRVEPGMIGVGAQLAFVFGRSFPQDDREAADSMRVADAVASCHVALQIVARTRPGTRRDEEDITTILVEGPHVADWRQRLDRNPEVALRMDGHLCASGGLSDVMGDLFAPLAWLARRLTREGGCIEAGDVVATGSCTGLVQLTPGHTVTGDFGARGRVELRLD